MAKKYFHILTPGEFNELRTNEKMTWEGINEKYQKPDWCSMHDALSATGCWSLTLPLHNPNGNCIDKEYCKNCEYHIKRKRVK